MRMTSLLVIWAGSLLLSAPAAFGMGFVVHGYDLGEKIRLTDGRSVWTAELDASLGDQRGTAFCVDLDTHIMLGSYEVRSVFDADLDPAPTIAGERPRRFAWAGSVMDHFGSRLDRLVSDTVTRDQALTGVQAAIWEGLYGGGVVDVASLSSGARGVFEKIMATPLISGGSSVIVEMRGVQDQVFSNPVPEPGAALVFGLGLLVAGRSIRSDAR